MPDLTRSVRNASTPVRFPSSPKKSSAYWVQVKAKNVIKFLKNGDKVKVSIRFKGRQLAHTDQGLTVMDEFYEMIQDYAVVEKHAKVEGRNMFMILSPKN